MDKLKHACGFVLTVNEWVDLSIYEYNGKKSALTPALAIKKSGELSKVPSGDHAVCPGCAELVHIDYDLEDCTNSSE